MAVTIARYETPAHIDIDKVYNIHSEKSIMPYFYVSRQSEHLNIIEERGVVTI